MEILLNGETYSLPPSAPGSAPSVADLVQALGFAGRRLAVEVNGELVPRSVHSQHILQPGDRVEVVQAIGGG